MTATLQYLDRMARNYNARQLDLADRTSQRVQQMWATSGGLNDAHLASFSATAADFVVQAQTQAVLLADAYMGQYLTQAAGTIIAPGPTDPAGIIGDATRGVPISEVYSRPVISARIAISQGASYVEAMAKGGERAGQLAHTDTMMSARATADQVMSKVQRVVGYRRVPNGGACSFCLMASTQRYHVGQLMPIHTRCGCTVAPIYGTKDPGHVINKGLLDELRRLGLYPPNSTVRRTELGPTLNTDPKSLPTPKAKSIPTSGPVGKSPREMVTWSSPKAEKQFGPTFDRLAKIHGGPRPGDNLPATRITLGGKSEYKGGSFTPGTHGPQPRRGSPDYLARWVAWRQAPLIPQIKMLDRQDGTQLLTVLHEFGHRMDFYCPDGNAHNGKYASDLASRARVRGEFVETDPMSNFLKAAKTTPTIAGAQSRFHDVSFVSYYQDPKEVWARAYSQWAATKLGGPEADALKAMETKISTRGYQWPEDEFSKLAPLVESVLRHWQVMT